MYEYDLYMDARRAIPRLKEPLQAMDGEYYLVKTDILAKMMTFSSSKESMSNLVTIPVWRVKEILAANRNGEKVDTIAGDSAPKKAEEPTYRTEEDSITRFDKSKKRKKKRSNKPQQPKADNAQQTTAEPKSEPKSEPAVEPSAVPAQGEQRSEQHRRADRRFGGRGRNNRFHNRRSNGEKGGAEGKPE
jgi:hypothetical protein